MRLRTTALGLIGAISLLWCLPVGAAAMSGSGIEQVAIAASAIQQVQYYERHAHRHLVKCYRELVVGPYVCRRFYRWWW